MRKNSKPASGFTLWVLWGVMTFSLGILYFVIFLSSRQWSGVESAIASSEIFFMAAAFPALLALFFIQKIQPDSLVEEELSRFPPEKGIGQGREQANELIARAIERLFTPFFVALMLSESVTLVGLIAALSQQESQVMLPYLAASLLLNLYNRPKVGRIREAAQRKVCSSSV